MNDVSMNAFASLPERHAGAARISIFFALWTLTLVLLHDVRVNAAPIYDAPSPHPAPGWRIAPEPLPKLSSESMWDALSERSDVISGRWSVASTAPAVKPPTPAKPQRKSTDETALARKLPPADASPDAQGVSVKKSSSLTAAQTEIAQRIAVRDFAGAVDALARARAENPTSTSQLRLLEAHIAIGEGDSERAFSMLLESLPDVRVSTQQHDLLAAVMLRTSRYAQAAAVYRALLTVDPANARWWAGYAVTQEKLDHRTELISAYRTLRSLAPPDTALARWASERLERFG